MKKFFGNIFTVVIGNVFTFLLVFFVLGAFAAMSMIGSLFQSSGIKEGSVLELSFNSQIKESTMDEEINLFSSQTTDTFYLSDILQSIHEAKTDDRIKGISIKAESFYGGLTQLSDIRNALLDFKESGKFIYAYSHNSGQSAYILSSVADSIFQNPLGTAMLQGLSTEVMFFKNFGDKYGIDFQVIRHGAYKSAVEPFMRDDLSPENKEQLDLLLKDIWNNLSEDVAKSRNIPLAQLNTYVDSLYSYNPSSALKYNLIDAIYQEPEYDQFILNKLGQTVKEDEKLQDIVDKYTVSLSKYTENLKKQSSKDQVAILYASGAISQGDGYSGIQSEVYKKAIRDIKNDKNIKAVVLRVNSPGGSADASEEILYELRELHKQKPIMVSFGDVAASGGYYISMAADSIFASPNTITGSIGVLGMIPNAKKLVNNIGLTTDYVSTNENANFLKTIFKPMSEHELKTMTEMTENIYRIFVNHVSEARNQTFEQVDSIGGGRVWSGTQALKIGLIDRFGNLQDAVMAAAAKADLEDYSITNYPIKEMGWKVILSEYGVNSKELKIQQELGDEYFEIYQQLKAIKEYNGIQLRMPFEFKIQ